MGLRELPDLTISQHNKVRISYLGTKLKMDKEKTKMFEFAGFQSGGDHHGQLKFTEVGKSYKVKFTSVADFMEMIRDGDVSLPLISWPDYHVVHGSKANVEVYDEYGNDDDYDTGYWAGYIAALRNAHRGNK